MDKIIASWLSFLIGVEITILLAVAFFLAYPRLESLKPQLIPDSDVKEYSHCNTGELISTSYCLRDYVSNFYKPNMSNWHNNLSFERLKLEGGVCWHYADLYAEMGDDLGYYTTKPIMEMNSTVNHQVAILSQGNKYCILDGKNIRCVEIK